MVGVDAVQHDARDRAAAQQPFLLLRDRDERHLGIARPQGHFAGRRRVMQGLHDRSRRQPPEGDRHRVVGGLVVDEVEVAGALDRCRDVAHLVEFPRPHVEVLDVALRERGVQRGGRARAARREQRDVHAAAHQAFGEEPGHQLDGARAGRRQGHRHRADVCETKRTRHESSSGKQARQHAPGVEMVTSDLPSRAARARRSRRSMRRESRPSASSGVVNASRPSPAGRWADQPVSCTTAGRPAAR